MSALDAIGYAVAILILAVGVAVIWGVVTTMRKPK